jgi:hypothetical protein
MITKEDIIKAQKEWSEGIIKMGQISNNRALLESFVSDFLDDVYNFQEKVLFKPTKAKIEQFRNNKESAVSYFIAGDNKKYKEDNGFALSNWSKITFENSDIIINKNQGLAMGNYTFENNESKIKVEYSFGYIKINESIKITLHHSSIPYQN